MRLPNVARTMIPAVLPALFLFASDARAQCSDAGACAISRHAGPDEIVQSHTLALRYSFGKSGSPDNVKYQSLTAEANLHLFSQSRLTVSLPIQWQSGGFGSVRGFGDLIAMWEQEIVHWDDRQGRLNVQAGMRFATGNANSNPDLPMTYQPGLGSNDVIVGTSLNLSKWTAGAAYQVAGSRNSNALARLERGDQLVLWSSYEFAWEQMAFSPGVTVIAQVQESSVLDSSRSFRSVSGSAQVQINFSLRVRRDITPFLGTELFGAIPLRPREVNVDGLKRSLVVSLGLFVIL